MGGWGSTIWNITHCLPRHIKRKLDWNWNGQDSAGTARWRLTVRHHNTGPSTIFQRIYKYLIPFSSGFTFLFWTYVTHWPITKLIHDVLIKSFLCRQAYPNFTKWTRLFFIKVSGHIHHILKSHRVGPFHSTDFSILVKLQRVWNNNSWIFRF